MSARAEIVNIINYGNEEISLTGAVDADTNADAGSADTDTHIDTNTDADVDTNTDA